MNTSKPEQLVAKLYEEGMSDRQVKKQLEDFGLSGKEAKELMKRAGELIEKQQKESKDGDKFIAGMKGRAKALPEKKEKPPKSSFFSGLFGSKKDKTPMEEKRTEEEAKKKAEKKVKDDKKERDKKKDDKRSKKDDKKPRGSGDRMMKLEKLKNAISSEEPIEEEPVVMGDESKADDAKVKGPDSKVKGLEEKEIVEIVRREANESKGRGVNESKDDNSELKIDHGEGDVSESKMDQGNLDELNKKIDDLQRDMIDIKQLLGLIKDLNVKLIEIIKSKEQ